MNVLSFLLCASVTLCSVGSERILAVFPYHLKSHFYVFEPVLVELAKRGHEVIVISQFPKAKPLDRYVDVDVRSIGGKEIVLDLKDDIGKQVGVMFKEILEGFEKIFEIKKVQDVLNSTHKFDLVMTELFLSEMLIGISHKLNVPLVEMASSGVYPWSADRFAIPDNPSYIRTPMLHGAGPMTFFERVKNTFMLVAMKLYFAYSIWPNDERVSKKFLGDDSPSVEELMKKASLYLVNSHFSLSGARPLPPQVVEIAGVHMKPTKPLPQDIEQFINESEHGVVYFSFGSMANASSMTDEMRRAFCNSFAKLKQRVLWKWEVDEMPEKPDNVKIVKWMPQNDILAHPNVQLFISHGGMGGTIEGVYNGIPMIGIPLFADQSQNIANRVYAGSAVILEFTNITEESVSWALNTVLGDSRYTMNAKHISKLFRDRPVPVLDTAIYWIEYVMRHKGAHHLRSAAVDLPWYQYLLFDVIGAFILIFVLVVSILVFALKSALRLVFGTKKEKVQ